MQNEARFELTHFITNHIAIMIDGSDRNRNWDTNRQFIILIQLQCLTNTLNDLTVVALFFKIFSKCELYCIFIMFLKLLLLLECDLMHD